MNKLRNALCATAAAATLATTVATAPAAPASTAAPVTITPTQLERGDDVHVPHLEGKTVVDGDVRIPVSGREVALLGASGDGYVVVVRKGGRWSTQKVATGRDPLVLARRTQPGSTVLADDGRRVAVTRSASATATTIDVLRASDGKALVSESFGGYVSVLDLDGRRAIVAGFDTGAVSWNLRTDRTSAITGKSVYAADISSNRLAFFTRDPYNGGCSVLTRLDAPARRLWTSCDERVEAISPNGNRIATVPLLTDGLGPRDIRERGVRGALLGSYRAPFVFGAISWESNVDLLVVTYGAKKYATVRASQGDVERVSALRPNPDF